MAERSMFFNSTEDDPRIYQASDWAKYMQQMIGGLDLREVAGTGVSRYGYEGVNNLMVSVSGNSMTSMLGAGAAFVDGYFYENDSALSLSHAVADPTNPRIDVIVLRLDTNIYARNIRAVVKSGLPAADPIPPSPVWNDSLKEIQVAAVWIPAGTSYIPTGSVVDTRADENVCGYLPLHNIYRGFKVDSRGTVTLPNQSYVEVETSESFALNNTLTSFIPLTAPKRDNQKEIKDMAFYPNASGTYLITTYVAIDESVLPVNTDFQTGIYVNGVYSTLVSTVTTAASKENQVLGSAVQYLEAGDKLEISISYTMAPNNTTPAAINTRNHRIRIAKIN